MPAKWGTYTQSGGPLGFDHTVPIYGVRAGINGLAKPGEGMKLWQVLITFLDGSLVWINTLPANVNLD
jgi:hypothetical protein|tara:strand:+ start:1848 stop:2051 length:204 start_codon:yes stop_codon:yes gene_type:complete